MQEQQSFKLTSKQEEALDLSATKVKNIMLYGGSRAAKTFFICWAIVARAINCDGSRHVALRLKFNAAKRSLWLDTFPKVFALAYPELPYKTHGTDYYYKLPNDSEVWIGGLDSKERTEKILGNEYSTIFFNECSQLDYQSVQLARTRLAQKNSLVKKTFYDQNPPAKSHWSYWVFEKLLNPLDNEPLKNPNDYVSLLMNPVDNLENIDEEYLELLESMPEEERNRFLLGLYSDQSDGQAYYAFDREQHVKELERRYGTLFVSMDFNVDPMTASIFQVKGNTIEVLDEVFQRNSDTFKMCRELIKRGYNGARVIPDSTGVNRKTSGQSDFDIIESYGFVIEPVHNPFVTDRVNNLNYLFTNNRILIDPKCRKLINDLDKVVWKGNKLDQKTDHLLTHSSDNLGYGAWYHFPININKSKAGIVLE